MTNRLPLVRTGGRTRQLQTGDTLGSTDIVPEGTTNLYSTAGRVLAYVLDTLTLTNAAIIVSDSVRVMFGKLQAQVTARALKGANNDITSLAGLTTPLTTAQGGTGGTFIPVQQGTGTGQNPANTIKIGWNSSLGMTATVDTSDLGLIYYSNVVDSVPWIAPTFLNGWAQNGTRRIGYRKRFNAVEMIINIASGTFTDGTTLFILPTGYIPAAELMAVIASPLPATFTGGMSLPRIVIDTSGNVKIYGGAAQANFCITFGLT